MMIGSLIKSGMKGPQYLPLLCVLIIIIVSAAFAGCASQAGTSTGCGIAKYTSGCQYQ